VTDSNDEAGRPDGEGNDGEQDKDLDELQSVSTSLRSAQHQRCESDASVDAPEDQSDPEAPEPDPDGLDELQPVSTSLRSAQSQAGAGDAGMANDAGDADGEDDDVDASDTGEESSDD
jgi:hypothetical protein